MEAGIVGLPNVGKSTLFNALTAAGADASNYPFCTIDPNVGVVPIHDQRLVTLNEYIQAPRVEFAPLRVVDIAGLARGASRGEGLGNQFLSHVRGVDAVIQIVRCFGNESITHVEGEVDPVRDIETIETELQLADLQVLEGALDKARRAARTGNKEARQRVERLERYHGALESGTPVRTLSLETPEERTVVKEIGLLTAKPVLYVANVDEADVAGEGPAVDAVRRFAEDHGGRVLPICAGFEAELMELEEEERKEMLQSVGLEEPALPALARAAHELLGLRCFFTTGEKEVRAWPVPAGTTAWEAAGVVHSDMQRGFIRAEVYRVEDLAEAGSVSALRAAGTMRSEGKQYVIQDGDVCHFLFNV